MPANLKFSPLLQIVLALVVLFLGFQVYRSGNTRIPQYHLPQEGSNLPPPARVSPRPAGHPPTDLVRQAERVFPPSPSPSRSPSPPAPVLPERRRFGVRVGLEFAGMALSQITSGPVEIKLYDFQETRWHSRVGEVGTDVFLFSDLVPGTFSCQVMVNAQPGNPPGFPGDYHGDAFFFRGPDAAEPVVISLSRLLRIVAPIDNDSVLDGRAVIATGILALAWEPIPEADSYRVTAEVSPHRYPRETLETTDSSCSFPLPPNAYEVRLEAFRREMRVGSTIVHSLYVYTMPDGRTINANRDKDLYVIVRSAATQSQDVSGDYWHDGKRFLPPPGAKIDLRLFRVPFDQKVEVAWEGHPGSFSFRNLEPGAYRMEAWADTNPANPPGFPGDMVGSAKFTVDGHCPEIHLHLVRIIRLKFPDDTDDPDLLGRLDSGGFSLSRSPVTLAWESLGEGVSYRYYLNPTGVSGTTSATSIILELPGGTVYNLSLDAYQGHNQVGWLIMGGKLDRPSYPFMVELLPEAPGGSRR